jgi:hypothetical protein
MDDESGHRNNGPGPSSGLQNGNNSNNNNNGGNVVIGGGGGGVQPQLPSTVSPYNRRIRRPSSSIISSTTSPIFQAPLNPNAAGPSIGLVGGVAHHQHNSRQRHSQNNSVNVINANINNFGPGDIDEDVHQPAPQAASSSRLSRAIAGLGSGSGGSVSASGGGRSQSPLGSPDSSTYWGASPSPMAHHGGGGGYRAPLTPGGMCQVSSSTSDDIPASPFSPDDVGGGGNSNHGLPAPAVAAAAPVGVINNNIGGGGGLDNLNNVRNSPAPAAPVAVPNEDAAGHLNRPHGEELLQPPPAPRSRLVAAMSASSSRHHHLNSLNSRNINLSQDLNNMNATSSSSSTAPSTSSSSSSVFNISPLRNKIKKASSFERFSAQAATNSSNNSASTASVVTNNTNSSSNDSSISSALPLPTQPIAGNPNNGSMSTNSSSSASSSSSSLVNSMGGGSASSSRLMWDPSLQSALAAVSTASSSSASEPQIQSSSTSALLRSLTGTGTEKFHIKIPSKKLAAKIASVFEQEQQHELAAAASAISGSSGSIISGTTSMSNMMGAPQIPVTSSLVQILNQTPSNIHVSNLISEESILNGGVVVSSADNLIRELSDVPLNLTETSNNGSQQNSQSQSVMPQRNPVISSRSSLSSTPTVTHSKKIHLTPKQKLLHLHRIQSAELVGPPLSPPPMSQAQMSQQIQMQSSSSSSSSQILQQQLQTSVSTSPVVTLHQSIPIIQETQQSMGSGNSSNNHIIGGGSIGQGPHSPPQLEPYSYESLLRSRDDFNAVQDSLGKVVGDDTNGVSMLYDTDYSSYCYPGIFTDEIFSGNNAGSSGSARQLLMMPAGNLQDPVDQPHGHFGEFVLGLAHGDDDHDRRDGDLQLSNDGTPGGVGGQQQQHCMDSNDAMNTMKSQSQADSALRSLLMMEPIRNTHPDDSWLLSASDYQSRLNCDMISSRSLSGGGNLRSTGASTLTISGGIINGAGSSSIPVNSSFVQMSNSMNSNNSWINDWPRTSWQSHPSVIGGGVQDQDEGMDMSMLEQDKSSISSKRLQMQLQSNSAPGNDHHGGMDDDMDLANGLPNLSSMPMPMPIDLHQPMGILQHGSGSSIKDTLPMDLQQHNRMDMDDEPVNLMAVNIEQELAHHHNSHHSLAHQIHLQHSEGSKLHNLLQQSQSHHHGQGSSNNNNSYTLQIQSHHGSPDLQQQQQHHQSLGDVSNDHSGNAGGGSLGGNLSSPGPEIIDERRIIRVKKNNKDNLLLINSLDEGCLSGNEEHDQHHLQQPMQKQQQHANVIMDKPIQPKSFASLPSPFTIARVHGTTLGVFTCSSKTIPANTRLGPVEGPLMKVHADDFNNINAQYPCLVMPDGANELWQLDRSDDEYCNWMKFVRMAHSYQDQNAMVVENDGFLYFITCKELPPKTELLVGYSLEYAQKYGFPYFLSPANEMIVEQHQNQNFKKFGKDMGSFMQSPVHSQTPPLSPVMMDQAMPVPTNNAVQQSSSNSGHNSKSVIVGSGITYQCFECDQEFSLVEDLENHLNVAHKVEEEIRKPKKKAIRKFQNPDNSVSETSSKRVLDNSSVPNIPQETVTKAHSTGQNQLMSADSSVGRVESSSSGSHEKIIGSGPDNRVVAEVASSGSAANRAQDNSVSTGGGQTLIPPKVKCTMCYKSFATKERLDRHMIVHSAEETKPLKCQFCTKRFLTNSALAGHIKTHAGKLAYAKKLLQFMISEIKNAVYCEKLWNHNVECNDK